MKVLILSTGTGEGHNSAAKAIKEQFDDRDIYCELVDVLSFASKNTSNYSKRIYIWSTVKANRVFKGAYKAGRLLSSSKRKSPVYYANALYASKLCDYIKEKGFDTIVMPHLFPAEALTYLLRRNRVSVKTYFIATDYTCIPFTEETRADCYFIPHEDLKKEFVKRGIDEIRLIPFGIPVLNIFSSDVSKKDARFKLGIDQEKKCIVLMSGSMGYGDIENLSYKLVSNFDGNLYLLCGNNEELKTNLRNKYQGNNNVHVVDFTNDTYLYMRACDVLFTKPGGLTSTEAIVANVPLVHTSPIPGCENANASFFLKHKMSIYDEDIDLLVKKGLELLYDDKKLEEMLASQRKYAKPSAAKDICEFIIKNGNA